MGFLWIAAILLLVAGLYLLLIAPCDHHPDASQLEGWLYAHRGLHDGNVKVPENSLQAFRLAVENGYGMELDVQLTADHQLVVSRQNPETGLRRGSGAAYPDLR